MYHHSHHLIALLLDLLTGGMISLTAASLAISFGWRSADRLPGESVMPQCVYCYRPYLWREMFPLLGWIGRRNAFAFPCPCGLRKNLWQQPVCEMAGFVLGLTAMYVQGWTWETVPLCLGIGLLPALALVDLHFSIIPDGHNILLGLFGLLYAWISDGDPWLAIAVSATLLGIGLFFALVYSKWRGREMLGLGDVKFFAAAGFWLHPHSVPWFLAAGGVIGLLFNVIWRQSGGGKQFPFAPALCLSLAGSIFYQLIFTTPWP